MTTEREIILHSIPELNRITSLKYLREMYNHLKTTKPSHNEKLHFVGFMVFAGYNNDEIFTILDKYAPWMTDESKTMYQIESISNRSSLSSSRCAKHSRTAHNFRDAVSYFLEETIAIYPMYIPNDIIAAAQLYRERGFTVVPKSRDSKAPAVCWKEFQDRKPTVQEWNSDFWKEQFKNGLILVATDLFSFLDIDPEGLKEVDMSVFEGRHIERTPRGGYHVFGLGKVQNITILHMGEVRGKGRYIVSYPSPGYSIAIPGEWCNGR